MGAKDKQRDLLQGTLDMLILKTLSLEPLHGYGIGAASLKSPRARFRSTPGRSFRRFAGSSATD